MTPIVILTSTKNRHKFFANILAKEFKVVGIVAEEKTPESAGNVKDENPVIAKHFLDRVEAEQKYFRGYEDFAIDKNSILMLGNGRSNDPEVFEWVKSKKPDYIVLFGTSIIKPPLLSFYENKIINIHLGLSPYYRGSGTNFWPLVNKQPECVGATIHLAILKVDAGSILGQIRPVVEEIDSSHDLGCKTVIAGARKMIECIKKYKTGEIIPQEQNLSVGQVCRRADFNSQAVMKMLQNFQNGMIPEYIRNKNERDAAFPIIE